MNQRMNGFLGNRYCGLPAVPAGCLVGLILFLVGLTAVPMAAASQPLYYAAIGTNATGSSTLRTQFEFVNEGSETVTGVLHFFRAESDLFPVGRGFSWNGNADFTEIDAQTVRFSVKPGTVSGLTMVPVQGFALGWGKLELSGPAQVRVTLQIARHRIPLLWRILAFEDQIERIVEVQPSTGIKSFSFPVWLWLGHRQISTAFAVVNTAGVPGEVSLTLGAGGYEGDTRAVMLQPGQMLADYFDSFWDFAVPAIFPFQLRSYVTVDSRVPLGVTAVNTDVVAPISLVSLSPKKTESEQVPAKPGEEFSLAVDQHAWFEDAGLSVRFWSVSADSRCPVDATCIWQGEAVVELEIGINGAAPEVVRLGNPSASVPAFHPVGENLVLRLVRVEPERVSSDRPGIEDYRVVLILEPSPKG